MISVVSRVSVAGHHNTTGHHDTKGHRDTTQVDDNLRVCVMAVCWCRDRVRSNEGGLLQHRVEFTETISEGMLRGIIIQLK